MLERYRVSTHVKVNLNITQRPLPVSSLLSPARAAVPHIWPAELPENHGQLGPVPAQVQPGAAVGGHRGVPLRAAQQESPAAQEVHQDCSAVSGSCPLSITRSLYMHARLISTLLLSVCLPTAVGSLKT